MGSLVVSGSDGEYGRLRQHGHAAAHTGTQEVLTPRLERESSLRSHKQLPRRQDLESDTPSHRTRYVISRNGIDALQLNDRSFSPATLASKASANPILPLTPPNAALESEYETSTDGLVTPTQQQRPPTPDYTPPRSLLVSQHSLASTRAESFRTAKEDFSSDDDMELPLSKPSGHLRMHTPIMLLTHIEHTRRPSPLAQTSSVVPSGSVPAFRDGEDSSSEALTRQDQPIHSRVDAGRDTIDLSMVNESDVEETPPTTPKGTYGNLSRPPVSSRSETTDSQIPRARSPKQEDLTVRTAWGAAAAAGSALAGAFSSVVPSLKGGAKETSPDTSDIELERSQSLLRDTLHHVPDESLNDQHGTDHLLNSQRTDEEAATNVAVNEPRRGLSLRDRLSDARRSRRRRSTEKFGAEIGWSNGDADEVQEAVNTWRTSFASDTSTIEALIVIDTTPQRTQTLRHRGKTTSLRSASSPIQLPRRAQNDPTRAVSSPIAAVNRESLVSDFESPKVLHHKRAKLAKDQRFSYNSDVSRSLSTSSAGVVPKTEPEIIRVAVIPERSSSLGSSSRSSTQSRRVSVAYSNPPLGEQYPPSSYHQRDHYDIFYRRRTISDASTTTSANGHDGISARTAPMVPARGSSLSAPTSRNTSKVNSRANSVTSSTSDHFRHRRIAAEKDLRTTLDRMESDRLISRLSESVHSDSLVRGSGNLPENLASEFSPESAHSQDSWVRSTYRDTTSSTLPEPGSKGWADLRPPSVLDTPFSQTLSMSPGPVEMGEAIAVNLFPHDKHSVQVIEQFPLGSESRAVQEAKKLMANELDPPSTTGNVHVDSPLRNPRRPPEPPSVKIIPPTPVNDHVHRQLSARMNSVRRPSVNRRRYSESFVKSITRNLSLKNARNKTAGKDLDSKLHPFWRPRAFWDGEDGGSDVEDANPTRIGAVVRNSLGIPQERNVIDGPISLVRHLSDTSRKRLQRQNQASYQTSDRTTNNNNRNNNNHLLRSLTPHSSHSSLTQIRASRTFFSSLPRLGSLRLPFFGIRDLQERMLLAKQRKEDERREKRRQDLRRSIGANVISQGDSRFLASVEELAGGRWRTRRGSGSAY